MERAEFIEKLLHRGVGIAHRNYWGWDWRTYEEYAELTSLVEYGCDFKGGLCKVHKYQKKYLLRDRKELSKCKSKKRRAELKYNIAWTQICCCHSCYSAMGHFDCVNPDDIDMLAKDFSAKNRFGFWREGKGCILPRSKRSITCLTYCCGSDRSQRKGLDLITTTLYTHWPTDGCTPEFMGRKIPGRRRQKWLKPEELRAKLLEGKEK